MDGALFGLAYAIVLLASVASIIIFVFCAWVLIDAVKRPERDWQTADQNKVLWLVILGGSWLVGIPFIAGLMYVLWPRPALMRAQRDTAA